MHPFKLQVRSFNQAMMKTTHLRHKQKEEVTLVINAKKIAFNRVKNCGCKIPRWQIIDFYIPLFRHCPKMENFS